jgi:hypothetical protein
MAKYCKLKDFSSNFAFPTVTTTHNKTATAYAPALAVIIFGQ